MPKLRAPLLGMKASGSIGKQLTFFERQGIPMVKKCPMPVDARTQAQLRYRGAYRYWADCWHYLSATDRVYWEGAAKYLSRTGFNMWMAAHLAMWKDYHGLWLMDEGAGVIAGDLSCYDRDLTLIGGGWTVGKFGSALSFDGVDDYAVGAYEGITGVTGQVSIAVWFWPLKVVGAQTLVANDWNYQVYVSADDVYLALLDWPGGAYHNSWFFPNSLSVGSWHQILCWYDGTGEFGGHVMVNNVEGTTPVAWHGGWGENPAALYVGGRPGASNPAWGYIDEIQIYKGVWDARERNRMWERGL